ncbi:MAG: ribosome-binding factor A [bacterium]|nr:ribosome-binding factor A [bacterium]
MSARLEKVNALITKELNAALAKRGVSEDSLVTVTAVEVTADLKQADCWVSIIPETDEAWRMLEEALPELQRQVAGRITLKFTPKLRIRKDEGAVNAGRITELLQR